MNLLGINAGHDASVCVLSSEGTLEFAIGEERLNRVKVFTGWPKSAISSIPKGDYHVCIANSKVSWNSMERRYQQFLFGDGIPYYDIFNNRSWAMSFGSRRKIQVEPIIRKRLSERGINPVAISFFDHHLCHAASAYYASRFHDALVITADGAGDGRSATAHTVIDGRWLEISSTLLPNSPGHMYGWATRLLGYKVGRHEGKLVGLAAFGDTKRIARLREQLLKYDSEGDTFLNPYLRGGEHIAFVDKLRCWLRNEAIYPSYEAFRRLIAGHLNGHARDSDVAALAQEELERSVTDWILHLVKKTGLTNVAMAGGVFANVKLNQRVEAIPEIEKVWIFPGMGDVGLSVGAAYLRLKELKPVSNIPLDDVYLGPGYDDAEILAACKRANLHAQRVNNLAYETAKLLANKVIVGWFQGRMEFGPRALGNRSILLHPGDPEMNQIVNKRLNRTEFMPFAPSVLAEYAGELFVDGKKSEHAAQFMTITYDVNKCWLEKIAAVVHVDGTARPQIVHRETAPLYWVVIDEFRKLTGVPAIVNTSFNMHEEPIVCTPDDAIRSFLHGAVDVLVLGDFFVAKQV